MSTFTTPSTTPNEMVGNNSFHTPLSNEQLQKIVSDLHLQVQKHDTLFKELDHLKEKIFSLEKDKQALSAENDQLRQQLFESQQKFKSSNPERGEINFPALSSDHSKDHATSVPTNNNFKEAASKFLPNQNKQTGKRVPQKKRIAAARAFQTPESKGPQGFQYVYIGRSRKILRSEVRSRLRKAGIDTGRVLDICFPASGVLGLLLHVQYVAKFIDTMEKLGADIIKDFDPADPVHLADPKFNDRSENDRENIMLTLVHERALDTLVHLAPLLVGPVSRYFVDNGWIDDDDAKNSIAHAHKRLAQQDPRKAAFLFRFTTPGDSDSDAEMKD